MLKKYPTVFTIIGLILLILFVWYFSNIVIYVLVSAVLAVIGQPLVRLFDKIKIRKVHMPHALSAFFALIVMIMVFAGFIWFFVPLISGQAKIISQINIADVMDHFKDPIMKIEQFLYDYDIIDANETIKGTLEKQLTSAVGLAGFTNIFKSLLSATGSFFFGAFSVLFLTFFFLKSKDMLSNFIILLVPTHLEDEVKTIMSKTHKLLSRYFLGLLTELTCMITLLSLGLYALGIENALIIGFLGGLMNIIPYLGPLIGGTMGVIIAVTTALSFGMYDVVMLIGIEVVAVFLVANLIDNIVLQPVIYSNVANAHPVEIFLVIIMAGSLAGIPGMILAIPAYTVIRIVAKEFLNNVKIVKKLTEKI